MMPHWTGDVLPECQICNEPITHVFVDGRTKFGPWAIMCDACHRHYGKGLGIGNGQRYVKQTDGVFYKTPGSV